MDNRRRSKKGGLTAKGDERQFVNHNYIDRSQEDEFNDPSAKTTEGQEQLSRYRQYAANYQLQGIKKVKCGPFPFKLHLILTEIEKDGKDHIISWLPHGRAFAVHKQGLFQADIMPKYFKQSKITSFHRQLNLYGFQRVTQGRDCGSYYNEYFLRGKPYLTRKIIRIKVKGTKIRAASSPDDEPNFYEYPPVGRGPANPPRGTRGYFAGYPSSSSTASSLLEVQNGAAQIANLLAASSQMELSNMSGFPYKGPQMSDLHSYNQADNFPYPPSGHTNRYTIPPSSSSILSQFGSTNHLGRGFQGVGTQARSLAELSMRQNQEGTSASQGLLLSGTSSSNAVAKRGTSPPVTSESQDDGGRKDRRGSSATNSTASSSNSNANGKNGLGGTAETRTPHLTAVSPSRRTKLQRAEDSNRMMAPSFSRSQEGCGVNTSSIITEDDELDLYLLHLHIQREKKRLLGGPPPRQDARMGYPSNPPPFGAGFQQQHYHY